MNDIGFPEATKVAKLQDQDTSGWELQVKPYGSFRGHFAVYNDELEIQGNGSRLGLEFYAKRGNIKFFVGTELAVNIFQGAVSFNTDATTSTGFVIIDRDQDPQVFGNRLGYLGLDFGKGGKLSIGKQWSVYYDITSYTDRFNVFGGQGSATYVASTDGGATGTGRAASAVIYRNSFGPVELGGQLQFRSGINGEFIDGVGLSGQFRILEGLKAGAAYNRSFLGQFIELVPGLESDPQYWALGASYKGGGFDLGLVVARQTNGDLVDVLDPQELEFIGNGFDATGLEFFARYAWGKWGFLAGINYYDPDIKEGTTINSDYQIQHYLIGAEYFILETGKIYAEWRIDNSVGPNGLEGFNVFTLGLRFDFGFDFIKAL